MHRARRFDLFCHRGMAREAERCLVFKDHSFIVTGVRCVAPKAFAAHKGRMGCIAFFLFHKCVVALRTKLGSRRLKQLLLGRPMRVMAGGALSVLDRLMLVLLCKTRFRIVVTGVAHLVRPGNKQNREIRPMRIMARSTHILGEGNMNIFGLLHLLGLHMAGEAKIAGF